MDSRNFISLSFFELTMQDFEFLVYRRPYQPQERRSDNSGMSRHQLPTVAKPKHEEAVYLPYWVGFEDGEDLDPFQCRSSFNPYVTCKYLYKLLKRNSESHFDQTVFTLPSEFEFARRTIEFEIESFDEGKQIISIQPYYLKSKKCFGFLADFRFRAARRYRHSRNARKLSLTLDRHGRRNKSFYLDRYELIMRFILDHQESLFLLDNDLAILPEMSLLEVHQLDSKRYVFGNSGVDAVQLRGIRKNGPFQPVENGSKAYFIFREADRRYSNDLFRALRGDTFPSNFPGMEKVFEFQFDRTNVGGTAIEHFDRASIDAAISKVISDAGERTAVPVFLSPFDRFSNSDEDHRTYIQTKHTCLSNSIPSQFVSIPLMRNNNFKWAVSSIALQLFAKMGGVPWTVQQSADKTLIVGISQALDRRHGEIRKYFAYSIFTDSTGRFRELKTLSHTDVHEEHISNVKSNLYHAIRHYLREFDSIVVHTTFAIKRQELDAITEVIQSLQTDVSPNKKFVVMKFNDSNKFFGYALQNNSMIPYESTFVALSNREFLIWYAGLDRGSSRIPARIERPLHVKFIYPKLGFDTVSPREYLQDALNISGANWRGFNAKSLPVSIFYAMLVAQHYKQFKRFGLDDLNYDLDNPWFL